VKRSVPMKRTHGASVQDLDSVVALLSYVLPEVREFDRAAAFLVALSVDMLADTRGRLSDADSAAAPLRDGRNLTVQLAH
jgi:hypothetical protein